jgi:hypothetical protein
MTSYQALTTTHGAVDIGAFPDINHARIWALQQYGADLQDVIEHPATITVDTFAMDPAWLVLGMAGLLLLAVMENKKRKRKRGGNVSTRR